MYKLDNYSSLSVVCSKYACTLVNATLQCAVNNAYLVWVINNSLVFAVHRHLLNLRGIFLNNSPWDGMTISSATIFGNIGINNNTTVRRQGTSKGKKPAILAGKPPLTGLSHCTHHVVSTTLLN